MSLEPIERKFRKQIPDAHRASLDTRLAWLWHQRFGTVQMVWKESRDLLDHTACTLILQAVMAGDLNSIEMLMQRIEGGAISDAEVLERSIRV